MAVTRCEIRFADGGSRQLHTPYTEVAEGMRSGEPFEVLTVRGDTLTVNPAYITSVRLVAR